MKMQQSEKLVMTSLNKWSRKLFLFSVVFTLLLSSSLVEAGGEKDEEETEEPEVTQTGTPNGGSVGLRDFTLDLIFFTTGFQCSPTDALSIKAATESCITSHCSRYGYGTNGVTISTAECTGAETMQVDMKGAAMSFTSPESTVTSSMAQTCAAQAITTTTCIQAIKSVGFMALKELVYTPGATSMPTAAPTSPPSSSPTEYPTASPSESPTVSPTTAAPTMNPTTLEPTANPTTLEPTANPTTLEPTVSPTVEERTASPTVMTSESPTESPTALEPSLNPPTASPNDDGPTTLSPTASPTSFPSSQPSSVNDENASDTNSRGGNGAALNNNKALDTDDNSSSASPGLIGGVTAGGCIFVFLVAFLLVRRRQNEEEHVKAITSLESLDGHDDEFDVESQDIKVVDMSEDGSQSANRSRGSFLGIARSIGSAFSCDGSSLDGKDIHRASESAKDTPTTESSDDPTTVAERTLSMVLSPKGGTGALDRSVEVTDTSVAEGEMFSASRSWDYEDSSIHSSDLGDPFTTLMDLPPTDGRSLLSTRSKKAAKWDQLEVPEESSEGEESTRMASSVVEL